MKVRRGEEEKPEGREKKRKKTSEKNKEMKR